MAIELLNIDCMEYMRTVLQIARECFADVEQSEEHCWQATNAGLEKFAQRIQPQWLPIDSAPKDRRIIIARAGHPWIHVGYWSARWNHWANGPGAMDYFAAPTHWMESIVPPEGDK